tara:strand:- start:1616 stop:2125 length:510 start_codon:yes stop_codon:yes gene_type:complete
MRYFDVDINIKEEDIKWMFDLGNNITEPAWTIRPHKLTTEEMQRILPISGQFPVKPEYAAIIMVPAGTVCKTHVDDKANEAGVRQRVTAINIPIRVHEKSVFQYMEQEELGVYNKVIEELTIHDGAKCWRVDIPHRVDNSQSPYNRVVLSLSYCQTIEQLYEIYRRTKS